MSAEVETMAYVGEVPWHGLGEPLGDEPVSGEEMEVASGLDWRVDKKPLYIEGAEGTDERTYERVNDWVATVRSSDGKGLGVVGESYQVIQNKEMFEFAEALSATGGVRFHTAGSLYGGRRVWALAEVTSATFEVVKGDSVVPYLLLASSHDGSLAFQALWTAIRVVCNNTLRAAFQDSAAKKHATFSIRHTGKPMDRLEEAQKLLGLMDTTSMLVAEQLQILAAQAFSLPRMQEFTARLLDIKPPDGVPDEEEDTVSSRAMNMWEMIVD